MKYELFLRVFLQQFSKFILKKLYHFHWNHWNMLKQNTYPKIAECEYLKFLFEEFHS